MQEGVELRERDFFQEPCSEGELRGVIGGRAVRDLFSWNSPSFKKLGLKREDLSDDRLIEMMLGEPRLIRRPLVVVGEELVAGSGKAAMRQLEQALA